MKIYFYPHSYLRDRHLDTIRRWSACDVVNPEILCERKGAQVAREEAVSGKIRRNWKQCVPLVNVKRRPVIVPVDAVVYVWGAVMARGQFITDLDNPYALVGYNPSAMPVYRKVLQTILRSERCLQIRCLSEACRRGVGELFGPSVLAKTVVVYPRINQQVSDVERIATPGPRFLFIGTQFEIKGGVELLRAFQLVREILPEARLDVVTHLPREYLGLSMQEGLTVHEATFSRNEIWSRFMQHADVLVHPSYMESFGMVVLEALAHGLAIVANDVYAHREMVVDGSNGVLLNPPVHYWNGVLAGPLFRNQARAADFVNRVEKEDYVAQLAEAMISVGGDRRELLEFRRASCMRFHERFCQ